MSKFKEGDKVVRVKRGNGGSAQVGQEAVVKSVEPGGLLRVYYETCADEGLGCELWLPEFAELVEEPAKASEVCRFIPGKTYKSRDGNNTYTFIGYCAELPESSRAVFALTRSNGSGVLHAITVNRSSDGTYKHRGCAHFDIMFEETVWVNLYRNDKGDVVSGSITYTSEHDARTKGKDYSTKYPCVYLGPFPVTING